MLAEVEESGDAERWVSDALDRGERLMGFGHRIYRAEDPRARVLRRFTLESSAMQVRDILCSLVRVDEGQNTGLAGRVAVATG